MEDEKTYARIRPEFRRKVIERKKTRRVRIGPNVSLHFEDRLTIQYQVQEMLRAERVFEPEGIDEELAAYNPLIPDGTNWKATFMLEYEDVIERKEALRKLVGIEDRVCPRGRIRACMGHSRRGFGARRRRENVFGPFLRFELSAPMMEAVRSGSAISVGVDHDGYRFEVERVPEEVRRSLAEDI